MGPLTEHGGARGRARTGSRRAAALAGALCAALLAVLAAGCAHTSAASETEAAPSATATATATAPSTAAGAPLAVDPRALFVTTASEAPALFAGPGPDAPPVGFLAEGVLVEPVTPPSDAAAFNDGARLLVRVRGPLAVRLYVDAARLGERVQRPGRVAGAPVSVDPNDIVRVLAPPAVGGDVPVEVQPRFERSIGNAAESYRGTFPAAALGALPSDAPPMPGGEPVRLPAARTVQVYDRPDGVVVATLPPMSPGLRAQRLRAAGRWSGVRIGTGPYLVGFVDVPLEADTSSPPAPDVAGSSGAQGGVPARIAAGASAPLARVVAGTRVRFGDQTIGVLSTPGYARVLHGSPDLNEADVFVAADDRVTLRGMVPLDALRTADGPAPSR